MREHKTGRLARYRTYLLSVLTIILLFNYLDRVALGLLLQDIKIDLHLSDTQLGFLGGIAFALFYSVMGIPIARWADRGNRVAIISIAAAAWSVMVALCGAAGNFVQLLLVRVGVAVGEAGCTPPAFSLLAEYFDRVDRPRATAIYSMGGALSSVVGFLLAGWLNELYGWRITFVLLGLPGLVLAALAWFTLREPRRTTPTAKAAVPAPPPGLKEVGLTLWANRSFRHLLLCFSVVMFFFYGVLQWQPTFFIRSFALKTGTLGTWLSLTWGGGCLLGSYLSGELSARYAARNEPLQLKVMAIAVGLSGVLSTFIYLSSNQYIAFGLIGVAFIFLSTINGPLFATIQSLVPERMRAVSFALVYLVANLLGMGFGPLLVGVLSDALRPLAGEESLRYAMLMMAPGYLWAAWHAWRASKTVARDVALASIDHGFSARGPDRVVCTSA